MTRARPVKLTVIVCGAIFLLALGVRVLAWQDNRREAWKVETFVTTEYKESARQLMRGDLRAFLSDLDHMAHPPGYAMLLAGIFKAFGESETAIQLTQMIADSVAAAFVFLIAGELLSIGTAALAGVLAALSPQFAYYSVLLLPDSIAILPILVAIYFLVRAIKSPRWWPFAIAGAFIGVSCWLRANALLLPLFLAGLTPLLLPRGQRLRHASALVLGALIVIAPITVKNAIVFHRFIPLSLGAGQKLLEGIAEYDGGRFDIPKTDLGIMRQEATMYHRPEYANLLFGPDGIERDRMRMRRGIGVVASHPLWYGGVMFTRGASFFRMARVPIVAAEPPVSHSLDVANASPIWVNTPPDLFAKPGFVSPAANAALSSDSQRLRIESDTTKYGIQIASPTITIEKQRDYLLRLPLRLEGGRVSVRVTDALNSTVLASSDVDLNEGFAPTDQPVNNVVIPFVSGGQSQICVSLANNAPESDRSVAEIGRLELFNLGPSSQGWMRYPRSPVRILQKFFVTAAILPCVILGIGVLFWRRNFQAVILLLLVPAYYVVFQSALHTERRYVVAIHYFLLMIAAVCLSDAVRLIKCAAIALLPWQQRFVKHPG